MDIKKLPAQLSAATAQAKNSIFDSGKYKFNNIPNAELLDKAPNSEDKSIFKPMPYTELIRQDDDKNVKELPNDGDIGNFFKEMFGKNEPKIKAKKTTTETTDTPEGKKTATTEEDVEISVDEYKKMLKDKLEGKEADPNVSYEFDEESISEAMWKTSDKDGNGYIDETEYKELLGDILDVENIENIDEVIKDSEILNNLLNKDKDIDANGDGKFSRDEFNNSYLNHALTDKDEVKANESTEEAETTSENTAQENSEAQASDDKQSAGTLFDKFIDTIKGFFDEIDGNPKEEDNTQTETKSNEETTKETQNPFQSLLDIFNNLNVLDKIKEFFTKFAE